MTNHSSTWVDYQGKRIWQPPPKPKLWWVWLIVGLVVLVCALLVIWLGDGKQEELYQGEGGDMPYVGALYVEDTMTTSQATADLLSLSAGGYNHAYLLHAIDAMMEDPWNRGLLLYIDSPGGEVIAADELSRKVEEYKETTGRPVYAYGYTYAASGGYWLASTADAIYLHPYCLTGSIGVTMGSLLDISGLLERYGVEVYNLASGAQKNGTSGLTPTDPETIAIYQAILEEYYEDFLDWVLAHRSGFTYETLQPLADGRVYTARQAVANGLADQVGDYEAALTDLASACGSTCAVRTYRPESVHRGLLDLFSLHSQETSLSALLELAQPQGILAYYRLGQ